ncbi:MAG: FliM/FliN family flagellar motor switch protein [Planctomycetota bacterium]
MSAQDYPVYDFKKAAAYDDSAYALRRWLGGCSEVMGDIWSGMVGAELTIELEDITTRTYEESMEEVTRYCGGIFRNIGSDQAVSLWHIAAPDILAVAGELLGQSKTEEAGTEESSSEARKATAIELSLACLFFENLIDALIRSWPGTEPLTIANGEPLQLNPGSQRLFRARDLTAHTRLKVKMASCEIAFNWIMAKHEMTGLLSNVFDRRAGEDTESSIEDAVEKLTVEVAAELGSKTIPMKKLVSLNVGDLFILDQKINEPVVLTIDGTPVFAGWPGKIGSRQGIEITANL